MNFGRARSDAYPVKFKKELKRIGAYPHGARVRYEVEMPVRILPIGSHLVVHEIQDGLVVIARVLHGSQNILDQL